MYPLLLGCIDGIHRRVCRDYHITGKHLKRLQSELSLSQVDQRAESHAAFSHLLSGYRLDARMIRARAVRLSFE